MRRVSSLACGVALARRIRSDKSLGAEVVFEMGPDGTPTRLLWHSNYSVRTR